MKGVSRLKPRRPKYTSNWDVSIVLKYLEELDISSLENITFKTIMLLALCTAQRAQTLSMITIEYIKRVSDGLEIRIPDLLKTSRPGSNQPCLRILMFNDKPKLCVASLILLDLDHTEALRNQLHQLFISIKRPYHAVSTPTISRWVKICLKMSGIVLRSLQPIQQDTSLRRQYSRKA